MHILKFNIGIPFAGLSLRKYKRILNTLLAIFTLTIAPQDLLSANNHLVVLDYQVKCINPLDFPSMIGFNC